MKKEQEKESKLKEMEKLERIIKENGSLEQEKNDINKWKMSQVTYNKIRRRR